MPLFNPAAGEVTLKVVYCGPSFAGKTSNLRWLCDHLACQAKGRLVSLVTGADRTLFFEFFPLDRDGFPGLRTRVQLYTVAGEVHDEASQRAVLRGCDAFVFVADSQAARLDADTKSLGGLHERLFANETDPDLPGVFQYNKRDLDAALPVPALEARLNPSRRPAFRAIATSGDGVEDTLRSALKLVFARLARQTGASAQEASAETGPATVLLEGEPPRAVEAAAHSVKAFPLVGPDSATRQRTAGPPEGRGLRSDEWLYLLDGEERGPVGFDELVDLVLSSLPEDTKVWRPGMETWLSANRAPEIADEIPPPVPGDAAAGGGDGDDFPDFETVPRMLRTVLIADEDATFRRYLAMPLAAQGFAIHEAGDGAAAWQLAVRHRPWLILADLSMPEVDGFEFCRRVRRHPLLSRKPIVFISGSDKYRDRYRALQIGADDFLSKSMPIRELLIRMHLVMTRYAEVRAWELADGRAVLSGALEGRLEVFGPAGLLQVCAERHLTGVLNAAAGDPGHGKAAIAFREGEVVSALVDGVAEAEGVYAFLSWQTGGFRIAPGDPGPGSPVAPSVESLLLEGCRRLEEARRVGGPTA